TKDQQARILDAIKEAEKTTSGEIKVHIETWLNGDVLDRAAWIFRKIGMHKTEQRNGILFYLAVRNKKFAVIGDAGINAKVPADFWNSIRDAMQANFAENRFTEGLVEGIKTAASQLREHFPFEKEDINELPDEISFEDNKSQPDE
ncbi:MAG: TPM domain-containing protein, partial [Bacteroidales bacterium]|nr:TPM domain-containing protein [Bacteroidales bacterium]